MAAAAADGSEQSGGFWNWVGDHPMESIFLGALTYKGGKRLWSKHKDIVLNFRTRAWNGVKNNWYWVVPGGFIGYKWMTGGYSSADEQDGSTNKKNNTAPTDSTTTPTDSTTTPTDSTTTLPLGFRPIVGINDKN